VQIAAFETFYSDRKLGVERSQFVRVGAPGKALLVNPKLLHAVRMLRAPSRGLTNPASDIHAAVWRVSTFRAVLVTMRNDGMKHM
jgi:hypothetical protein